MTFAEALTAWTDGNLIETRISRPDGPSLIIDELGQIRPENDCLYVGDILNLDDWQVGSSEANQGSEA